MDREQRPKTAAHDEVSTPEGELLSTTPPDEDGLDTPDIDRMTDSVMALLSDKQNDSQADVYAWSDGSVTDGETPPFDDTRLISLFSPVDAPSRDTIRDMLNRGFESVELSTRSQDASLPENAGYHPKDVPGDQEMESAPPIKPGRLTTNRGPGAHGIDSRRDTSP